MRGRQGAPDSCESDSAEEEGEVLLKPPPPPRAKGAYPASGKSAYKSIAKPFPPVKFKFAAPPGPITDTTPPTKPTNLQATVVSTSQINLAWNVSIDSVGIAAYLIERCAGASCSGFAQIVTSVTPVYSNTGLSPATSYSYRVRAVDAAGNLSDYSTIVTAITQTPTVDTTAPTIPQDLTATVISSSQINLTWTPSTDDVGVSAYLLEHCQGVGCSSFSQINTPSISGYSHTGLAASTSHSYRVRAIDAAGNVSGYSSTVTAVTQAGPVDTVPPSVPSNVVIAAISSSQINLSWTASTDNVGVTGYRIERCQGAACSNFVQIGITVAPNFADSGLLDTTLYRYRVRATDAAGNLSSYSAIAGTTTLAPPAPGTGQFSFTLTSTQSGTLPFTLALPFKKGDVTNGPILSGITNYQSVVKRLWNDGSIKHVIVSGRASFTANVPINVVASNGTAPTGTNLSAASIQTAAPTASVQCGAIGTVNLSSLLASPFRTWISGPEMVECHYRSAVGADASLAVWFHVRLFVGGRIWIRVVVENGYLNLPLNSPTKTYVPTIIIGGVTVYNNSGASLSHYGYTRYAAEGWIGGNPAITPSHNSTDLINTKLVPNYWKRTPSAATLNALTQTYTPMGAADLNQNMPDAGFHPDIGTLTNWDALYCATGDARAYRSMLATSSSMNSFPIAWRDSTTQLIPKPSDFPSWNEISSYDITAGAFIWEINHHPSMAYVAYLTTGDYWFYETMMFSSAVNYLCLSYGPGPGFPGGRGTGVNKMLTSQDRGTAWTYRSLAQACALAYTGDAVAEDYKTLLHNNMLYWQNLIGTLGGIGLGYLWTYGLTAYDPSNPGVMPPWMQHFNMQVLGFGSDIEPLANMTAFNVVRDWLYRGIVGILGPSGQYCFNEAGTYNIRISDGSDANDPSTWYATWTQVYSKSAAISLINGTPSNTLLGTSGSNPANAPTGYWGNLLPAIAYAVDHGANGATAAYTRLIGASNWSTIENSGFSDIPVWGIIPRSPVTPPTAPVVAITSPSNGATVTGIITVTATASDDVAVLGVQFKLDGANLGAEDTSAPYSTSWNTGTSSVGAHVLTAVARDAAANSTTSAPVNVTVPAPSGVPAWVAALPLWQWYSIPNTALSSVAPAIQPLGATGPQSKIVAWCGAGLRRSGSIYILGAAGGHADYAGNEVNTLALNVTTPAWVQHHAPTPNAYIIQSPAQFYLQEPDGRYRPAATHTYYAAQFIDALDRFIVLASPGLLGSFPACPPAYPYQGSQRSFSYNYASAEWDDPDYFAQYTGGGDFTASLVVKHQTTGDIYTARSFGASWWRWNRASNTWTQLTGDGGFGETNYCASAMDPTRNRIMVVGDFGGATAPRIHNLNGDTQSVTFTGLGPNVLKMSGYPGMVYDEANDTFLVVHNSGATIHIYRVTAGGLSVDEPTVTGSLPAARSNGVLNSVQYVPELKGIVIANSYSGNVQFMRTAS